jgi:DNA-directed RNA polymerase specialized sigma24 family protein
VSISEGFVADHSAALLRTAYLLTNDRGHAEDLLQTTLLRMAWRELDVAFPSGTHTKYLVLRATGLAKETLIKMATVHMTPHEGSPHPPDCAPNCAGG